jgi:hypothetical protein
MAKVEEGYEICEPVKGANDGDALQFGLIWQIAAVGLSAVAAVVSGIMLGKQMEIARQYLAISQGWHDWYNQGFRPLEDQECDEVMAYGPETPFYDSAVGRARALGRLLLRGEAGKALRCTSAYQTGLRQALLRDAMIANAETLATLSDLGWRMERDRTVAMDALNYSRKLAVLNRGREMAAGILSGGTLAAGIFSDLGKGGAANFTEFLGYALTKKKTDYGEGIRLGTWRRSRLYETMGPVLEGYAREERLRGTMDPVLRKYAEEGRDG